MVADATTIRSPDSIRRGTRASSRIARRAGERCWRRRPICANCAHAEADWLDAALDDSADAAFAALLDELDESR